MIDVFLLLWNELAGSTPFYIPILVAVFFGFALYMLHRRFAYPRYILKATIISGAALFIFLLACICMETLRDADAAIPAAGADVQRAGLTLLAVAAASILVMLAVIAGALYTYAGFRKKLRETMQCVQQESFDYSPIAAWRVLENLPPSRLTRKQRANYEKYRIYLRMLLGNLGGVAEELEKIREKDRACYHFLNLYDDAFSRAIRYCGKSRVKEKTVWETLYYNYVFNRIRMNPHMLRQQWEALLEPLKSHLDMENPRDYMAYSNIVLELLRQTDADRGEINRNIYESFDYLMRSDIPTDNRCVLEASFARMVWSAMGDPTDVLRMLERDREHLFELPMPARYHCFHQIDIFFTDLHGGIVEKYDRLKQSAFWYMMNQAQQDLEEYRRSLPAEAVYERCFCLKELAGRYKKNPQSYRWEAVAGWMENAAALYRENGLELEAVLCELNMMDEATSPLNMDQNLELMRRGDMEAVLERIEEAVPKFEKHPVMAEIALREVCRRITARLPQECPTIETLSELYRMTMLPVSADGLGGEIA